MEEYYFSFPEYKLLKKYRSRLEKSFDVRIFLPKCLNQSPPPVSIFIYIGGEPRNISYVKNFLKREMSKTTESSNQEENGILTPAESIPIITIDDETDDSNEAKETITVVETEKTEEPNTNNQTSRNKIISSSSLINVSKNKKIESSSSSAKQNMVKKSSQITHAASSFSCSSLESESSNPPQNNQNADDSIIILSEVIVSSTSTKCDESSSLKINETKKVKSVNKPLPEFIPLRVRNAQIPAKGGKKRKQEVNDCVEVLAAVKERRVLRPIVIDGSNVARFHGRPTNTFSCKGIKICVDYFLKRGHTDIKVLLPHFKKYVSHGPVVTTNSELLDELESSNIVVYTPSRRVNDRRITCYDDRFIVSLATQNNGVIVSNDNYRDIITECAEFKKTVDERLLMFCFAGDIIMIPEDPLGINGPSLNDFLSMKL